MFASKGFSLKIFLNKIFLRIILGQYLDVTAHNWIFPIHYFSLYLFLSIPMLSPPPAPPTLFLSVPLCFLKLILWRKKLILSHFESFYDPDHSCFFFFIIDFRPIKIVGQIKYFYCLAILF